MDRNQNGESGLTSWWYQVLQRAMYDKNHVIITMTSGTQFQASEIESPGRMMEPNQPVVIKYKVSPSAYTDYPEQTIHIDIKEIVAITVWKPE